MPDLYNLSNHPSTPKASALTRHQLSQHFFGLICLRVSHLFHLPIVQHLQIRSQRVAIEVEPYLELVVSKYRLFLTEYGVCEVR
jgi:hypothetical protein